MPRNFMIAGIVLVSLLVSASAGLANQASLTSCTFSMSSNDVYKGACGPLITLFDRVPTVTLTHVGMIKTGSWRNDMRPISVWSGTMKDREHVEAIELEIYPGAWGIFRTDEGWFPATNVIFSPSKMMFDIYPYYQISPGALDRKIIERAAALLSNNTAWNRADDRECPVTATTLSIYCAMEKATIQITGGFQHTRPALQVVRAVISERSNGRNYHHLLMDYNNDPNTELSDVQAIFKEALEQMENPRWLETNGFVRPFHNSFQPG